MRRGGPDKRQGVLLPMPLTSSTAAAENLARSLPQDALQPGGAPFIVTTLETPLGTMLAGAIDRGVCLLEFHDRRALRTELADLARRFRAPVVAAPEEGSLPGHLREIRDQLGAYFRGELRVFSVPLVAPGTAFQARVWDALRAIPYGQTCSYGDIARGIGQPDACRAVGAANGANRIAIVIPCHRVIESNGKLRGYGGGLHRKRFLLELEAGGALWQVENLRDVM